jgi:hypothetical protein
MRYWDAPIWKNDERGRAMVARDLALTTKDYLRLGIELAASGELLGTCALWGINCKSHDLIQRATSDQLRFTG